MLSLSKQERDFLPPTELFRIIVLAPILGTHSLPFKTGIAPATFAIGRNGLAGKHSAVLLASHRPVVSGTTRETASGLVSATEELEETAKLFLLLRGTPISRSTDHRSTN